MGLKDSCKALSKASTAKKLVFQWGDSSTSRSNVVKTPDLRVDVHRDFEYAGYAIAKIQVNKDAKDPGAKEFLKTGNKGSHKTTHKNLAEIRYSQVDFNEAEFKRQVADTWKTFSAETAKAETGESSASGGQMGTGQTDTTPMFTGERAWEWDNVQKMNKYWDGELWVYWDTEYSRGKYWDGTNWQWRD